MKFLPPVLLVILLSCVKHTDVSEVKKPEVCHFGITYNTAKRDIASRPPTKKQCNYQYAEWGECIRGYQYRTYTNSPKNCVGLPVLSRPCVSGGGVIYLDFDGELIVGTAWNFNGDINAVNSGLSEDEQAFILAWVQRDFALYNVIVTSDEEVFLQANVNKRMRVVITESWEWYGQAGGVAFLNSMFDGSGNPCFVFSSLLYYNTTNIAKASSHEVGHTIGLYHQGTYDAACIKLTEYSHGCCGEVPIMGFTYAQPVSKWIKSCAQDDLVILGQKLGLK